MVTLQSFCYFLNYASNQKISFTKVVQFAMLIEIVIQKAKFKLSFAHKPFISSLSKLNIVFKNFSHKSCSVWYAIWECGIKSESLAAIYGTVTFNICYQIIANYYLLSVTCYMFLAIWIYLSEPCYYLQKLVPFARNFLSNKLGWDALKEQIASKSCEYDCRLPLILNVCICRINFVH